MGRPSSLADTVRGIADEEPEPKPKGVSADDTVAIELTLRTDRMSTGSVTELERVARVGPRDREGSTASRPYMEVVVVGDSWSWLPTDTLCTPMRQL